METAIIFLVVNVVLAFAVGVLGNMATPKIQTFFKRSSLSWRESRIESLRIYYENTKFFKDNPIRLGYLALNTFATGLMQITALIFLTGIDIFVLITSSNPRSFLVTAILSILVWAASAYLNIKLLEIIVHNVADFERFRDNIKEKVRKLGGNPEDLDREEA